MKMMGALALGGVIFWNVAQHAGPQKCVAYVHVSTSNVDVTIDDDAYHVTSPEETPLVLEIGAGQHVLRMARRPSRLRTGVPPRPRQGNRFVSLGAASPASSSEHRRAIVD